MSILVPADELADTLGRFGGAYLVTVGADRRAHIVAVAPVLRDNVLQLGGPGRTTRRNVVENPVVSLVWPPIEPGGHSLIADGTGSVCDDVLIMRPTRAVLHRQAATDDGRSGAATEAAGSGNGGCTADCVEVRL